MYEYNLEKAKQLMKEAGYADGVKVTLWGNTASKTIKGMEFIKQQLSKINIDVKIMPTESGTLHSKIAAHKDPSKAKVQMWYVSWSPSSGAAYSAIYPLFSSESYPPKGYNTAYYDNEKVDNLLEKAKVASSKEKLQQLYAKIQKIVYNDAPWLFMGVDTIVYAHRANVKGVKLLPDGSLIVNEAKIVK